MSVADRSLYNCHVIHMCVLYALLLCVVSGKQHDIFKAAKLWISPHAEAVVKENLVYKDFRWWSLHI